MFIFLSPARVATLSLLAAIALAACGGGGGAADSAPAANPGTLAVAETPTTPAPEMGYASTLGAASEMPVTPAVTPVIAAPPSALAEPADSAIAADDVVAPASTNWVTPAAGATDYMVYVAPTGEDYWSGRVPTTNAGRTDGPVKTLAVAQARARAALAAMSAGTVTRGAVRVIIAPGEYALTAPLAFTPADSGTADAPVSYEATPASVVISGGIVLPQVNAGTATTPFTYTTPTALRGVSRGGGQLYVNGTRATLARQPNAGQYWFVQRPVPLATEAVGQQGREAFAAAPEAKAFIDGLSAADRSRATINIFYAWTVGHHRLSTSGEVPGAVRVSPRSYWTFLDAGPSQRFYVENVAGAMDTAGEWIYDDSSVQYRPLAAEVGTRPRVVMPALDKLVTVSGEPANSRFVEHLQFRGLTFSYSRSAVPDAGLMDHQAAIQVSAAVEVDTARNIVFHQCNFTRTGGYGLWLRQAVRDSSVTDSTFTNVGAGGIKIGMYNQPASGVVTGNNRVTGNRVGYTGKLFPSAVGIWLGQTFDNTVANNAIYNTTYSGISVGWTWGFGAATSGRNTITKNLLVNIGQGEMSDMGAIYTVGVSPGTVISRNLIREVRAYPQYGAGAWGIYLDSGSSDVQIVDNVIIGSTSGGFHLNAGRNNLLQNNVLGLGDRAEMRVTLHDAAQSQVSASGNLLVPKPQQPFDQFAQSPDVAFSANLVSDRYATTVLNLAKCGAGCSSSVAAFGMTHDPRGVTLQNADTARTTFVAQVAAQSGPPQVNNASIMTTVPFEPPPVIVAPPVTFELDILGTAVNARPLSMWYSTSNSAAIGVATNAQAAGGKCLKLTDSSSNSAAYDPHTYAPMNHESGTTAGEFSILIDSLTNFQHEWRDNGNPFKTGPSLRITAAGVKVGSTIVAPVTIGQWMKFVVTTPLGGAGTTWSLVITDGLNRRTAVNNLPFVSAGFSKLNWWGFISHATVSSSFCLASVKATNAQ